MDHARLRVPFREGRTLNLKDLSLRAGDRFNAGARPSLHSERILLKVALYQRRPGEGQEKANQP